MSKKTAMQELIAEFTSIKETKCKTMQEVMFFDGVLAIIDSKYLEKEKKQIKDDYNQGYRDGEQDAESSVSTKDISEFKNAENYYSQTYQNETKPKN